MSWIIEKQWYVEELMGLSKQKYIDHTYITASQNYKEWESLLMSNVVLILSTAQMTKMKGHYQTSLTDKTPPGSVFVAKPGQCTVTAYKSGKVLFQGASAEVEAKKWSSEAKAATPSAKKQSSVTQHRYSPPAHIGSMSVIGSDEVGTGDYFGPMTVVAVYAKKEQLALLKELGVQDSKNLKDPQIIDIAKQIKNVVPFSLLVCDNPKYNALQARGMSQGKMKALLHNQAIKHVIIRFHPNRQKLFSLTNLPNPMCFLTI